MNITMIDRCGDFKQGTMYATLSEIESVLGKANCADDTTKVKHSWGFEVDGIRCGIWDYYGSHKQGLWSVYGPLDTLREVFPGKLIEK